MEIKGALLLNLSGLIFFFPYEENILLPTLRQNNKEWKAKNQNSRNIKWKKELKMKLRKMSLYMLKELMINQRPASLGTALQQHWPLVRMKLMSFLSSSAVHGPFFSPTLSQHGCLPILIWSIEKLSSLDTIYMYSENDQERKSFESLWNVYMQQQQQQAGRQKTLE